MNEGVKFGDHATRPYDAPRKAKCKAPHCAPQSSCQIAGFYGCCASIAKPQGILEAQGTFLLRPCVRVL